MQCIACLPLSPTTNPQVSHLKPQNTLNFPKVTTKLINPKDNDGSNHQDLYKSYFDNMSSLCKDGKIQRSLDLFAEMESRNLHAGPDVYGEILQGCVYERALFLGQQIHAQIIKKGDLFSRNEYIETKLVIFYAKCDVLEVANHLFRRLEKQNVFSWAAIIGLQSRSCLYEEALLSYCEMQENGVLPDNFVIPNALKACGALQWNGIGKGIHGNVVKMMGFGHCVFVSSSLVDMYGKFGFLEDARKVFDAMPEKNVVAWNSMIVGYAQNGLNEEAIKLFHTMRMEDVEPTQVTLSGLLTASSNLEALEEGRQGHALAIIGGLALDNILGSSLVNFYSKVGLIEEAELVFSKIIMKDEVTWNLLTSCYVQNGLVEKALDMCHLMREENLRFDCVILSSLLTVAADIRNVELGMMGHSYCIKSNFESDLVVSSSIIDMYAKCGKMDYARRVFSSTTKRDIVLWNTMLAAYAELGLSGEVLRLFYRMQMETITPNVISWNSVILGFFRNGQVTEAQNMFSEMYFLGVQPNLITWTTMMSGLAQNGRNYEAILVFKELQNVGIRANSISMTCALSACTNMTLLKYGRAIHGYVLRHYVSLSLHIRTSIMDMYAKCGAINAAKRVFNTCSRKELPVYNAMISAYALHGQAIEALALFRQMEKEAIVPDHMTFTSVLSACSHAGLVKEGLELFGYMVSELHMKPSSEHYGCLIKLLSLHGHLDEALRIIITMPSHPDAHILGSMLVACGRNHEIELAGYIAKWLLKLDPGNSGIMWLFQMCMQLLENGIKYQV
ncbi:LOW QUALITY PROTEIN: pentatricopeptide repeat-containing protein At5g55740, chloroplastic-like [Prosopis cineraria]|uniref:LOW QUALITY PROTEIN: pentatricopeptide repeat-containing protein At5g55740, chloroplastic-like n=1 Tax=Prosopis cineraria TaxID=364024 RepID=UPI00240EBAEF|nr:LOW QUALITY PROTEIN: pentatricopeptide repeat-containing protein At5g55740, chloroplastic-like [Prosopis cineraria]